MIARWLREPLLQFLVIGLLLFVGSLVLNRNSDPRERPGRIELTADDLRQIRTAWLAQGRPPLTPEQLQSLVEARVHEEILYREALALGLDKDDTIVKRRMAQKMEFLFEDVAALREPTTDELRAWFAENAERFTQLARASFRHHRPRRQEAAGEEGLSDTSAHLGFGSQSRDFNRVVLKANDVPSARPLQLSQQRTAP